MMTVLDAMTRTTVRWGERPKATDDAEWLVIAFERAALTASQLDSTMEDAEAYGILRRAVCDKLRAAPLGAAPTNISTEHMSAERLAKIREVATQPYEGASWERSFIDQLLREVDLLLWERHGLLDEVRSRGVTVPKGERP